MGADIYLRWEGMTENEKERQYTGWNVTCGRFGYLRGAYNGHVGLDAIRQLFEGVDWDEEWEVDIAILEKNLEKLEKGLFKTRHRDFYRSDASNDEEIQSYRDFVDLAASLIEEGKNVKVQFSY